MSELPKKEHLAYLKRKCEQLYMDNKIKQSDINKLQAQVNAASGTGQGTLVNLDDLIVGAIVEFTTTEKGEVFSIHDQVLGKGDHINSVRAFIRHEDNCQSYHTYRFDGRSHHSPCHDIVKITRPA